MVTEMCINSSHNSSRFPMRTNYDLVMPTTLPKMTQLY